MSINNPVYHSLCQALSNPLESQTRFPIYVGFSGGLDSMLLLHCACTVFGANNVVAVHVNHGLSTNAEAWQDFCAQQAAELGCHFQVEQGQVESQGQGVEAAARSFRYEAFAKHVGEQHALLLAHHLDDQIETFFLRMMRGAGLHGLKAMAPMQEREHYQLYRPWLAFSRQQLEAAAQEIALQWVEDESNLESTYDRNYLRNEVLPLFEKRWPKYRSRVHTVLEQLNSGDVRQTDSTYKVQLDERLSHDGGLKWVQLDDWAETDKVSLLHLWLTYQGVQVASQTRLRHILTDVVDARADAEPKVRMGNGYVRRHGPALYWVADQPVVSEPPLIELGVECLWPGVGQVNVRQTSATKTGLRTDLPNLHWRLRQGGEQIRPAGRSKRRDLKRLMQEYRVKPWQRDRLPLLFSNNELVAVADLFVSADHLADQESLALEVFWQKS